MWELAKGAGCLDTLLHVVRAVGIRGRAEREECRGVCIEGCPQELKDRVLPPRLKSSKRMTVAVAARTWIWVQPITRG